MGLSLPDNLTFRTFAIQIKTMGKVAINIATGSLLQEELIVGIDLGTTNSLIAIVKSDTHEPIALREIDGLTLVPSIVHFDEYGNVTVGNPAKELLVQQPERTIYSAKRLMGKSYSDVSKDSGFFAYNIIDDGTDALVKVQVGDKFYSPIELSSYILKELKKRAEHILKTTVTKAVITVPAYFNDAQRQATRDAGRLAGLDVLRIINEPTAASLAYGIGVKHNEEKTIAVYDLGEALLIFLYLPSITAFLKYWLRMVIPTWVAMIWIICLCTIGRKKAVLIIRRRA